MIPLNMIVAGTRLRGTTPEQVAAIAVSIAEVGLLSPITVYPRQIEQGGIYVDGWGLVAGLHRLEACRSLGWTEIPAHVVTLGDLHLQLAECDENLCGTKLSPAERVLFTRRRKHAYEALHPETRNGTNQHTRVGKDCQPSFADDTAARTGNSARTVRLNATRGERIADAVLSDIKGTAQDTGRTLDALAAVPKDQQSAELERLRAPQSTVTAADHTHDPVEQEREGRVRPLAAAIATLGQDRVSELLDVLSRRTDIEALAGALRAEAGR